MVVRALSLILILLAAACPCWADTVVERMPTAVATTTDGGRIAWTNQDGSALSAGAVSASNGHLSNQSGSFAKVTLDDGESARIDLYFNGAFAAGEDPLPADAEIVAIDALIHLLELAEEPTGAVYTTVQLLVGGEPAGENRSDGRTIRGHSGNVFQQRIPDRFGTRDSDTGDLDDLWGLGIDATAANILADGFGVRIEVSNATGSEITLGLDTAVLRVIHRKALEAVIDANGTDFEVYDQINLSAHKSHFGSYRPEECSVEWTFDYPPEFAWTVVDKRGGVHQEGRRWNLKGMTLKGFCIAVMPTVPGTYETTLTIRLPDGTTSTDTHVATVAASTRDELYVDSDGDDSDAGTQAEPKATIDGAIDAATGPTVIYVKGGQTHTWAGGTYTTDGIHIKPWPGTGTPTILVTSPVTISATNYSLGGFEFDSTVPLPPEGHAPFVLHGENGTLHDITAPDIHWLATAGSGAPMRNLLLYNIDATIDTYLLFNAAVRTVEMGVHGRASAGNGNGFTRTGGPNGSLQEGFLWSLYFCSGHCNNTDLNAFRSVGAWISLYGVRVDDGNMAFERWDSGNPYTRMAHTYLIDGYYQPTTNRGGNATSLAVPFVCVQNSIINGDTPSGNPVRALSIALPFAERTVLRHNTLANHEGTFEGVLRVAGDLGKQIDLINNLWCANFEHSDLPWLMLWYIEANATTPALREARGNVYGYTPAHKVGGTTYTNLATWNALDYVSGEAVDNDPRLEFADLSADDDFGPPEGHAARTNGLPVAGVWHDYRMVPRDPEADVWYVGATGGEAYVSPDGEAEPEPPAPPTPGADRGLGGRGRGRGRGR